MPVGEVSILSLTLFLAEGERTLTRCVLKTIVLSPLSAGVGSYALFPCASAPPSPPCVDTEFLLWRCRERQENPLRRAALQQSTPDAVVHTCLCLLVKNAL